MRGSRRGSYGCPAALIRSCPLDAVEGCTVISLSPHPLRGVALNEVHARPFIPISGPKRLLHFGFMTSPDEAAADRARFSAFCEARGKPIPRPDAKHHSVTLADAKLRWEQHSEFTTYTWEMSGADDLHFDRPAAQLSEPMLQIEQPGPLLVAVDLHLRPDRGHVPIETMLDESSTAAAVVDEGGAFVATDFQSSSDGFIRILVFDRGLSPMRAGALVQRLLEIETYRILALLGLPEAQSLAPSVRAIEDALTRIARSMAQERDLESDSRLLEELTQLAAEIEADANASGYRLGASRAYDSIVQQRLAAIGETPVLGYPTIASFLTRRMAPAMRTCQILEERLNNLSQRLSRAAQLLRTRVDVEIEQQNRTLLETMNERVRLQLLLQQTVEGLSIAAISYYIVSLVAYVAKGLKDAGGPLDPGLVTAVSVPFVVLSVAVLARRIRKRHSDTAQAPGRARLR